MWRPGWGKWLSSSFLQACWDMWAVTHLVCRDTKSRVFWLYFPVLTFQLHSKGPPYYLPPNRLKGCWMQRRGSNRKNPPAFFPLLYFPFGFSRSRPWALSSRVLVSVGREPGILPAGLGLSCRIGPRGALPCPDQGRLYRPIPSLIDMLESQNPRRSSLHEGEKPGFPTLLRRSAAFVVISPRGVCAEAPLLLRVRVQGDDDQGTGKHCWWGFPSLTCSRDPGI